MADATTKKILELLAPDHPVETRAAAVLILGETATADRDVSAALCERLADDEAAVRLRVIEAVGKLKVQDALPHLLARVEKGGDEASESANAAAKLGARGTKALQDLMSKVAPGLRRYIASALGASGSASGDAAAIEFLLDKDPGVVGSAVRSLISQVPTMSAAKKHSLSEQLLHLLKDGKTGLPVASEAAAVRLLAALGDVRAEAVFWVRCVAPHPLDIRAAALQALGAHAKPGKDQMKRLFACAVEKDFRVAAPALMMLQHQNISDKSLADWLPLLQAPDIAARRLVLEKLDGYDSAQIADALLPELTHPDRAFRDQVLARLAAMDHGKKALQQALLDAPNADAAWTLARSLAPRAAAFPKPLLDKLFAQACKHHDANDRRADPFFFFFREADAAGLRDRLEQTALNLRKKKAYDEALGYLKMLARDPAVGFSIRFELACVGLKVSAKELASEFRAADPCLTAFGHLVQGYEAELLKGLEKAKWLEPEDLYYLGFHFIEKEGGAKKFGGAVLGMIVKHSPKSKVGKDAKTKLKVSGLA